MDSLSQYIEIEQVVIGVNILKEQSFDADSNTPAKVSQESSQEVSEEQLAETSHFDAQQSYTASTTLPDKKEQGGSAKKTSQKPFLHHYHPHEPLVPNHRKSMADASPELVQPFSKPKRTK